MAEPSGSKIESLQSAAGLAPALLADASSKFHADTYRAAPNRDQTGAGSTSPHGLLSQGFHCAIDGVASAFGKSDGDAKQSLAWDASDTLATFAKSVPMFMGRGKGTMMAGVLTGLDEVHLGDSPGQQMADLALGVGKGVASKSVIDKFAPAEMSLLKKGAIIGGGSSFADSLLSRHTWSNENGQVDLARGLKTVAGQTAMGTIAGSISFPIAGALSSKLAPQAERLLGKNLNPALIASLSNGASFGVTSGFVGETTRELVSGKGLDPSMILKRTVLDGMSTMAGAGTGFRLAGGHASLPIEKNAEKPNVGGAEKLESAMALRAEQSARNQCSRLIGTMRMVELEPQALRDLRAFARTLAGKKLEPRMLEAGRDRAGESGYEFMRDYIYRGSEPVINDWRFHLGEPSLQGQELAECYRPAARQLIGLADAAAKAEHPVLFEQKLSALARDANFDVKSFLVQYGESSDNPKMQTIVRDALRLPNFEQPLKPGESLLPKDHSWLDGVKDSWRSPDERLKIGIAGIESDHPLGNQNRDLIDAHLIAVDVFQKAYDNGGQYGLRRAKPQAVRQWLDGISDRARLSILDARHSGTYTTADGKTMMVSFDMPAQVLATYDMQVNSANGSADPLFVVGPRPAPLIDPSKALPKDHPFLMMLDQDPKVPLDDQPDAIIRFRAEEARRRRSAEE
ncbi:MAG TPA: hypothetical protein V6C69_06365 [Trichormus sp.]|jgi:hypothetical protein